MGIILDELGVAYELANDGEIAVSLYKEKEYGLILMDINMPNMNGLEATKEILALQEKSSSTAIAIIAVTANALIEDKQKFLSAGMTDYISKPYSHDEIKNAILKHYRN